MINVVVPTSRVGGARQAERVVDARAQFARRKTLGALWLCLRAAVTATLVVTLASCGEVVQLLQAPPGTSVRAFARDLDHPRWLYVLPNGDVLVAETNAPSRPDDGNGIQHRLTTLAMKPAGAGVPSANRITLLRDADGDGVAELRSVLIDSVKSPFGMALVGDQLYVAASDAVLRFPYVAGATRIVDSGTKVMDLHAAAINHHRASNLITGTVGFDSDLLPDPLSSVRDGVFFGWPYGYDGSRVDDRVVPPRADPAVTTIASADALTAQTGSKGLAASGSNVLPATYADGRFVGQHGSWNRRPYSGYKVIFVPFENGKPSGVAPVDVLTGFVSDDGDAFGRPAGVFLDNQGALLVADDVGNVIWRVTSRR